MKLVHVPMIDEERIAAFIDGNLSPEEMNDLNSEIAQDNALAAFVSDFKADLEGVDRGVTIEQFEPDFDAMGAVDSLFSNTEISKAELQYLDFEFSNSKSSDIISNSSDISDNNLDSIEKIDDTQEIYSDESMIDVNDPIYKGLTKDDILQEFPDTCAIKSQQIILESHDIDVSEKDLVMESIDKGWYEPGGGTKSEDVGNLLEAHDMTVHHFEHPTIDDIAAELAKGHQVIVGVDSGELWQPGHFETFEDFLRIGGADHALIVSGIQVNPLTAEREIILTDPGTGEVAHTYTLEQFEDAWDDSDHFMITAEL